MRHYMTSRVSIIPIVMQKNTIHLAKETQGWGPDRVESRSYRMRDESFACARDRANKRRQEVVLLIRPSTNQNTQRGPSQFAWSSWFQWQYYYWIFWRLLYAYLLSYSNSSLICTSTPSSPYPPSKYLYPLLRLRPTSAPKSSSNLPLTLLLYTNISNRTTFILFNIDPTICQVYIEPRILCFRVGFHPRYSYSSEFIIEGAVDYCPEQSVSHFFTISNTRYPTVVNRSRILGIESLIIFLY